MNKVVDFLALFFHIKTVNNTEGCRRGRLGWFKALLPLVKWALLLVVGYFLSLMLFSLVTDSYFKDDSYFKERNTTQKLKQLAAVILKQRTQTALPENLEEVVANNPVLRDLTVDSWGKPILYQLDPVRKKIFLTSAGKDKQLHTADDLVQVVYTNSTLN